MFTRLRRNGRSSVYIDLKMNVLNYGTDAKLVPVTTDQEAIEAIGPNLADNDFVVARLRLQKESTSNDNDSRPVNMPEAEAAAHLTRYFDQLHQQGIPGNTLIFMVSGHGNTKAASELLNRRSAYNELVTQHPIHVIHETMPDKVFGEKDMEKLENEIRISRLGFSFFGVSPI